MAGQKTLPLVIVLFSCIFIGLIPNAIASKGALLGHNPKSGKMTKIVYRHLITDEEGQLREVGPFKLYLYSDKYVRLESPKSQLINPAMQLMIVSLPESWFVNTDSKEAYYAIKDEHLSDIHLKIFPEAAGAEDYDNLYFGNEFKYFFLNKPAMSKEEEDGISSSIFAVKKKDIELTLIIRKPTSQNNTEDQVHEIHVTYKGQVFHKYLIDEYLNDLPVDMTLFSVPSGVDTIYTDEEAVREYHKQKEREKKLLETAAESPKYNDPHHRWILACSGVLWERNRDDFITVPGQPVSEKDMIARKKMLAEWWDIENRKDLFETLSWLTQGGGHRIDFEETGKKAAEMSTAEYYNWLNQFAGDGEKRQEIRIAKKYYNELGAKSISGWDYCRYICLCRWGYSCGYIEEEEAWYWMNSIAKEIQKIFSSWQEYGQNYIIGRQFWSREYTLSEGDLYTDALKRLTENTDSPWNTLPWNLDLSK